MSNHRFKKSKETSVSPMIIFVLAASFYLYEYILQVAPSVMAEPMMRAFHVSAKGFGVISAFYFYAYAPMQLPAGLLFDRYGPRRLMTYALILCALGSIFFASTDALWTAALGRFCIGMGSAFSFIGVLVLVSRWFQPSYFALLAGTTQLMASVGAIFGEVPLAELVNQVGWRNASFILAFIGFFLAGLIWRVIRDYPLPPKTQPIPPKWHDEWRRLIRVLRRKSTWIIGMYAFSVWTPIAVFGALWGVPFLQQRYGISVVAASGLCSMIWIGVGIGSPLLGWLSDRWHNRRLALWLSSACGLVAALMVLYMTDLPMFAMYPVLFLFGMGASGQTVSFAVVNDLTPPELVGTASGFNNLSVLVGGAIFQPLVGVALDCYGGYQITNGVVSYSIASYQHALIVLPLCFALGCLVVIFGLRESHPGR